MEPKQYWSAAHTEPKPRGMSLPQYYFICMLVFACSKHRQDRTSCHVCVESGASPQQSIQLLTSSRIEPAKTVGALYSVREISSTSAWPGLWSFLPVTRTWPIPLRRLRASSSNQIERNSGLSAKGITKGTYHLYKSQTQAHKPRINQPFCHEIS
jgi:hypothetical protein